VCYLCHTISSGLLWPRFATSGAEASLRWPSAHALPEWKEGWGVYPAVGGALLLPLLLCEGGAEEIEYRVAYYFTSWACMFGFSEAVHYL